MFEVKCTSCGDATTVPFKPTPGKPVYCRTCFSKQMTTRSDSHGGSNNEGSEPKQFWARRRDNGHAKKEEAPVSVFQRRYDNV